MKTIGSNAFSHCISLTSIDIPYYVKTIDNSAFNDCTSLKNMTIHNPYCNIYDKSNTIPEKTVIKGYFSSTAKHYAITYERDFLSIGTYTIGDVNEDGMIDSSDASMILAEYALIQIGSESSLTEAQRIAADVNRDYSVDSTDASKILAYYAKVSTGQDATLE